MSLQVSTREVGDVTILDLRGRSTVDIGESDALSKRIKKLIAADKLNLLLNLADVIQIDSSGISVIIEAFVSLRACGGQLRLLRPSGRVLEVFKVVHLLEIIPSFDDEAEALASFHPRGFAATP